jgi:hypothetical protein
LTIKYQEQVKGGGDLERNGAPANHIPGSTLPVNTFGPTQHPMQQQMEVNMGIMSTLAAIVECVKTPGNPKDPKVTELRKFSGNPEDLEDFLETMDIHLAGGNWSEQQKAKNLMDHLNADAMLAATRVGCFVTNDYGATKAALRATYLPGGEYDFHNVFEKAVKKPGENYFTYGLRLVKMFGRAMGDTIRHEELEKFVKTKWVAELPAHLTTVIGLNRDLPLLDLSKKLDAYVATDPTKITGAKTIALTAVGAGMVAADEDIDETPFLIAFAKYRQKLANKPGYDESKYKDWMTGQVAGYEDTPRAKKTVKWCDNCQSSSHNVEHCITKIVEKKVTTTMNTMMDSMKSSLARMEATVKDSKAKGKNT